MIVNFQKDGNLLKTLDMTDLRRELGPVIKHPWENILMVELKKLFIMPYVRKTYSSYSIKNIQIESNGIIKVDLADDQDCPDSYIDPKLEVILLIDVTEDNLSTEISRELGIGFLDPATEQDIKYPIRGIVFGYNSRPFINLVVSLKKYNKLVNVIFIVDTGRVNSHISAHTMEALGCPSDSIPNQASGFIQGEYAMLNRSVGNCVDLNLVGSKFMTNKRVTFDYINGEIFIDDKEGFLAAM